MTYKRKLIEVALPLEAINAACQEDKDRKTGHIRNLHKWFAPMPLAAMRALIFSATIDDPGDQRARDRLHEILTRLVQWEVAEKPRLISEGAKEVADSVGEQGIIIFDPFCGGGSTLVEAQRLGLESLGSDLNPIPVLLASVLTNAPRFVNHDPVNPAAGATRTTWSDFQGLKGDIRHYTHLIYERARRKVGNLYPLGPDGNTVIAWRWARTVPSPDPHFRGRSTLLVGSWWLSRKPGDLAWIEAQTQHSALELRIRRDAGPPPKGNAGKSNGSCLLSGSPISIEYIRDAARKGRLGLEMLALITQAGGKRDYFLPDQSQREAALSAKPAWTPGIALDNDPRAVSPPAYGLESVGDLFTSRQLAALGAFCDALDETKAELRQDAGDRCGDGYVDLVERLLAISIGRLAQYNSTLSLWRVRVGTSKVEAAFGRNDIPITWDFAEANPFGGSVGDYLQVVQTSLRSLDFLPRVYKRAEVVQLDARAASTIVPTNALVVTDPPYFDQIPYAALADFFYPWLRRALGSQMATEFSTLASPKEEELVANRYRHGGSKEKAKQFFVRGFVEVFSGLAERLDGTLPMVVVYANRQQETLDVMGRASTGWDAMLGAVLNAGWSIEATWPVRGTGTSRQRGIGSNALATYVVLVCRRRARGLPLGTRSEFLCRLRDVLPDRLRTMQAASIAPVDLQQAAIGPGISVFSTFERVVETDGAAMAVRTALALINQVVDEVLAQQEADLDPETRWALSWFEQFGAGVGAFGIAENLSKAKNTAVNALVEAGIVESKAGKVRLLERGEMSATWDPTDDRRLTVWEITQHLVRALEQGEQTAADLLRRVGGLGESARELAYRLYVICDRKRWAQEALAYNSMVVVWPEIARLAAGGAPPVQPRLGE